MNAPIPASRTGERYLDEFERLASVLPGQGCDWLRVGRRLAIERFARRGFPGRRDEGWRYIDLRALEKADLKLLAPPAAEDARLLARVEAATLAGAWRLVFVDGRLSAALSGPGTPPAGLTAGGLAAALDRRPDDLEDALADAPGEGEPSAFADLNFAFMSDGACLRLAPGARVETPIQLIFIAAAGGRETHVRNLVEAAEGSSARIVEQHIGSTGSACFNNVATRLRLAAGAGIEYWKLQEEGAKDFHIAEVVARQGGDSRLLAVSFAFGAALARAGIDVRLEGEGARCRLEGLYLADGRRHVEQRTRIDHLCPGCASSQFYKGVAGQAGHAVFAGRTVIHPGAGQSEATQANRNLLLSDRAEADSQPQLEIWADDVKCSHAATVGSLNEDQVFYLRARGIDEAEARRILTRAFAQEMLDRAEPASLRAMLDSLLGRHLPQP